METARKTMRAWLEHRGGTLNNNVFPSPNDYMTRMRTRQYAPPRARVGSWHRPSISGLSDAFPPANEASIIYKATGNLRAVQILLGHAKIDSLVRYLGVDIEDALELAERTEVRADPLAVI
jgi:site-specific recombinase XerC